MRSTRKCPKCGETDILFEASLYDHFEVEAKLGTQAKPNSLVFKGGKYASVNADVCMSCGYAELFVKNPEDLRK